MAKTAGNQVNIGLGMESAAAPGVAVAESVYPQWTDFSMQGVSEKELFTSARGVRNESSNSFIKRKYSQGSVAVVPNVEVAPYFFNLALGSLATALKETGVYEHTITVQNANASMRTATLTAEEGAIQTAQYVNCVVDSLNLEVSDSYAKMTMEMIGKFPGTDTLTESFTQSTEFAYPDMTVRFGANVTAAVAASATPLKSFSLNIANNVQLDEAFLSGSNEILAGGLVAGRMKITGSYSLHFSDTTELAKYKANTKNACEVRFAGASIGATEQEEISIRLSRLVLTKAPIEYSLDGLLILTQEFEVEYNATDKEITVIVTNTVANAAGATYNPA